VQVDCVSGAYAPLSGNYAIFLVYVISSPTAGEPRPRVLNTLCGWVDDYVAVGLEVRDRIQFSGVKSKVVGRVVSCLVLLDERSHLDAPHWRSANTQPGTAAATAICI